MISGLLNSLKILDYMLMVVKSTENKLTSSSQFIFEKIQKLYAKDLSDRMLGIFTFSDGGEGQALTAVNAAGIKLAKTFKFNNSAMWDRLYDALQTKYFELGQSNFKEFADYIIKQNKTPISLKLT